MIHVMFVDKEDPTNCGLFVEAEPDALKQALRGADFFQYDHGHDTYPEGDPRRDEWADQVYVDLRTVGFTALDDPSYVWFVARGFGEG